MSLPEHKTMQWNKSTAAMDRERVSSQLPLRGNDQLTFREITDALTPYSPPLPPGPTTLCWHTKRSARTPQQVKAGAGRGDQTLRQFDDDFGRTEAFTTSEKK
ncbi:MAG: hypothetical protein M1818_003041 [Claussenomyces sp. TS43310]|nr:MAG: hypothetical protein M1818_003041 [Claussenomyces sp. TS43310]